MNNSGEKGYIPVLQNLHTFYSYRDFSRSHLQFIIYVSCYIPVFTQHIFCEILEASGTR